ncbi:Hypothetical_protein [Hexamita inflata]|uniref:Hypothetical_protein n=1 Tax=Hexamita inflata TaxID=28002 RepID=A0AA86PFK6_9EUKA|nr:Hypothetical protein HINF_LOCUS24866 [Hexamita inflata]
MEDFFFQSQPGAQDEVLVLRLIRIIIQVVTVAFILNIQIMNAFLLLEEWNQVGQSGPALNNILMLLQNNSYFTYDLPLPFHNEKSIFLIVKLYNVRQSLNLLLKYIQSYIRQLLQHSYPRLNQALM